MFIEKSDRWKFEFQVTNKPLGAYKELAEEKKILKILEKALSDLNKGKDIEQELLHYIEIYPEIPMFYNRLSACYLIKGDKSKSKETNLKALEKFPDYIFARIGLANDYYNENNYEAMLETLGEDLELNILYPEKNIFHIDEVIAYYRSVAFYLNEEVGNGVAFQLLDIMKDKFPSHLKEINRIETTLYTKNFSHILDRHETSIMVNGYFIQTIPASSEIPIFENEIINELYNNGFELPCDILTDILNLPDESLERDLKKVLISGITRYTFIKEEEIAYEEKVFVSHAIFIAAEKKIAGIIPELMLILKGGNDFADFYLEYEITELLWIAFYKLFENDPAPLFNILRNNNIYTFFKMSINNAIEQLYYHHTEHQQTIVKAYKELVPFFIENKDNEAIKDTELIASIVCTMKDICLSELNDEIKLLYDNELISIGNVGKYKHLIKSRILRDRRIKTIPDIHKMYEDEMIVPELNHFDAEEINMIDRQREIKKETPLYFVPVRTEPKTGRNDPCPCGSGKKYKKCCMKED